MSEKSMHKPSGTDWDKLRCMLDEDIVFDEDSPRTRFEDWEGAKITRNGRELGRIHTGKAEPSTTLDLPDEVLTYFKSSGPDWQTRIGEALKEWIAAHPLA
jgi:uncharacterized protein (DUF4415 family)